jgi:hypothetical protein
MRAIAVEIAQNPSCLRNVEWRDLERLLREVFEGLGFDTQLTRSGKDGGFDLMLKCMERGVAKTFLVEVKHWVSSSKKPGRAVFAAFFDIVASTAEGTIGVLLSSSGFTKDVQRGRTEIEQQMVRIGDGDKIVSLCQNYLQSREGLWIPTTPLPHLLLQGTQ